MQAAPNSLQKVNGVSCSFQQWCSRRYAPKVTYLLAVTVYPIDIEYEEKWWLHTLLSESNTHGEQLWYNPADTDTNFLSGVQ